MRSVFVCDDDALARRVREGLAGQSAALAASRAPALRRSATSDVDSVALVGSRAQVEDAIGLHREALGMTHLVARVQVPGAEPAQVEAALERLAELAASV
jgi:alkanesulfonate monooxygenase SsuD/methylene tetrahydromethanopterin reductase-like flavin-dependent oxidoreductase (luciferase family)